MFLALAVSIVKKKERYLAPNSDYEIPTIGSKIPLLSTDPSLRIIDSALTTIGSIKINRPGITALTTKAGTGFYNSKQNNGPESLFYFGENPYSGWAINQGINSLQVRPLNPIQNYSSTNSAIRIMMGPIDNTNMSLSKDGILRKNLQ